MRWPPPLRLRRRLSNLHGRPVIERTMDTSTIYLPNNRKWNVAGPIKCKSKHSTAREFTITFDGTNAPDDGIVKLVMINGKIAAENDRFSEDFGKKRFGEFLQAEHEYRKPNAIKKSKEKVLVK